MTAFSPLLGLLEEVPDPRRAEGKLYRLPHVLLFSILARDCRKFRVWSVMMGKKEPPHGQTERATDT